MWQSWISTALLCKCASYTLVASHVWLSELSLYILTRLLTRAIVWLCLFACLLYLYLSSVFVSLYLSLSLSLSLSVPSPPLSLVSCWSSSYIFAIATYPHHRQLPTLGYCFCKIFNKLSATLNVKFILPSYWLSFCQSSNQQAVTLVCSIYFSRIVPRESNAHGYLYFPFQSLYKCSKHETRNWINMRIIYY